MAITFAAWLGAIAPGHAETCRASYYGYESGRFTATGEHFNPDGFTAAHRSLPFGTRLRVSLRGKSVTVRVNDRGPASRTRRCLDLSHGAAARIGLLKAGVAVVTIEKIR